MKPELIKSFNLGQENYFAFEVKNKNSYDFENILINFLENLGFKNPFYSRHSSKSEQEDFAKKPYKKRVGLHKFLESKDFKIHIIFSADCLNLVVKCNSENRKNLVNLIEKYFRLF